MCVCVYLCSLCALLSRPLCRICAVRRWRVHGALVLCPCRCAVVGRRVCCDDPTTVVPHEDSRVRRHLPSCPTGRQRRETVTYDQCATRPPVRRPSTAAAVASMTPAVDSRCPNRVFVHSSSTRDRRRHGGPCPHLNSRTRMCVYAE